MLSMTHMIVVFIVVLVVFGPQKLPELARGLGKLMAEFRKASADFRSAFEQEMRDMERQATQAERKKAEEAAAAAASAAKPSAASAPSGVEVSTASSEANAGANGEPVVTPVEESVPHSDEPTFQPVSKTNEPVSAESSAAPAHDHQQPA